ncbi:MAG: SLBB domain-containing protein [Bacteroidetes bacterium]|nr:SLBB domain-containing protein [Bacteroidota bacterium]
MLLTHDESTPFARYIHRVAEFSSLKSFHMSNFNHPVRAARKLIVAFSLSVVVASVTGDLGWSQISSGTPQKSMDPSSTNPLLLLQQRLSQGAMTAAGIPLEGAVDPLSYIVGPGDSFSIAVAGQSVTPAPVVVGIDGRIVLPDAGAVQVSGKTLAEAREDMLRALRVSFARSEIEIALVQSRQFYVHVSGSVPRPGRYLALPVARVSSVLEFALADTSAVANSVFRPSLRNIQLLHTDGSTSSVDLVRYFAMGDVSANPYLTDGDVISVPSHDPNFNSVSVGGYVPFPGRYDFKQGDHLADLFRIAGGRPDDPNIKGIRVSRTTNGSIQTHSFTGSEAFGEKGQAFVLQPLDVISVSQINEGQGLVSIEGRVEFPGTYPIVSGKTTLKDLMAAAGGPKADALLRGAFIERKSTSKSGASPPIDRFQSETALLKKMQSSDSLAFMQHLRLTDLGFLSRAYFTMESRLQNRVSLNLVDALSADAGPIYLESDDRIIIPKDVQSVYVLGQVNQPGYLPVQSGMTAEYYIAAAGGRSKSADRVIVVNPATGSYSDLSNGPVFSGDVIFVDRIEPLAETADQQRLVIEEYRVKTDARFRTVQTVLQSVATLASAIALIISLRR